MRYELYLRSAEPTSDLVSRIRADLEADPDLTSGSGKGFEHEGEDGTVTVAPHLDADPGWDASGDDDAGEGVRPLGLDLSIAGGAGEALATQLAELAFEWAQRWALDVYDPQLGRTVEADDLTVITARVKQHSDYLTDTVGLGDKSTRYMDVDVTPPRLSIRSRFYLGLAAALLLLGLAAQYCS